MSLNNDGSLQFINHYKVNKIQTITYYSKDILSIRIDVFKAELMVVINCLPFNFTLENTKEKIKKKFLSKFMQTAITLTVTSANR